MGKIANDWTKDDAERMTASQNMNGGLEKKNSLLAEIKQVEKQAEEPETVLMQDLGAQREEQTQCREELTQQNAEQASEKIQQGEKEINKTDNGLAHLEEKLSLGDWIRNRVKEIFKKYGFTMTAVLLTVETTIDIIFNALSKEWKSVANGVGNGLQELGKK